MQRSMREKADDQAYGIRNTNLSLEQLTIARVGKSLGDGCLPLTLFCASKAREQNWLPEDQLTAAETNVMT